MDIAVFLAVLAAAACHAGWNAVVKGSGDPMVTTGIVSLAAGWVSLALLPIVGMPSVASLPWAVASAVVHLRWEHGTAFAELTVDLASLDYSLQWSQGADTQLHRFRC